AGAARAVTCPGSRSRSPSASTPQTDDRDSHYCIMPRDLANRTPQRAYGGVSAEDRIAARRAKLLDAGLELFGTRGYATTGVKDVCREAGLTDRYFYESF